MKRLRFYRTVGSRLLGYSIDDRSKLKTREVPGEALLVHRGNLQDIEVPPSGGVLAELGRVHGKAVNRDVLLAEASAQAAAATAR